FILNVRDLTDPQVKRLEKYVADGGAVAFFLGPLVSAKFYNEKLYREGAGIFPVPLSDTYFPPVNEDPLKPVYTGHEQVVLRDYPKDQWPIFGPVFKDEKEKQELRSALRDFPVKRYFKVPRGDWKPGPDIKELATLPNERPITEYQGKTHELLKKTKGIIENNAEYKIYLPAFERHNKIVSKLIEPPADQKAFYLGKALDEMLKDPKGPKDAGKDEDRLNAFWDRTDDPKIVTLRGEIEQLEKAVKYGEPFIVLADNKKGGKVLAVMTTAGKEWNDWGGGSGATILYQPFIWGTINYLTSQAQRQSNDVGR